MISPIKENAPNRLQNESVAFAGFSSGVRNQKTGFTLIELVMVITLLAVITLLLLPLLAKARETTLTVQCLNNMKELQMSYHMYVLDNDGYLPLNFVAGGGALSNSWVTGNAQTDYNTVNIRNGTIFPYNKNIKIYGCPANTYMLKVGADGGTPPYRDDSGNLLKLGTLVPETRTCSIEYSMGGNSFSTPNGPWTITAGAYIWNSYQKFSQLQPSRISTKIVFVDEASGSVDDGAFALWPMNTQNYWWNIPGSRHDRGSVFSFADGHVEYYKWHGTAVPSSLFQTQGPGNGGPGLVYPGQPSDSSDDLPRVQTGGPQYP